MASNVHLPTWSLANGQDDIAWYSGANVMFNAEKNIHPGNQGQYQTDAYATVLGKQFGVASLKYNVSYTPNVSSGNAIIERAIANGLSLVGRSPYNFGGGRNTADQLRNSFDCSSFVSAMFARAGHTIDNQATTSTWSLQTKGIGVSAGNLRRGDLIIMNFPNGEAHVVIYLGNGYILHDSSGSPTVGVGVNRITDVCNAPGWWGMSWQQMFSWAHTYIRRVA
ncbi:cell wall-associated hydrolase with YG repeats [Lactococcus termiticola]|uniref:Cell wall-associated hydrolase with YG repeats n=2 Tax=Lactococcus termiticola TaxID=2169526 RepID=A0A2R5HFD8_9LACT|nr:cell wall-associated hydrolase with YG repeats [Lactococcus termiticola]